MITARKTGYFTILVVESNRELCKNHIKNDVNENFSRNSCLKTIEFQVLETFKKKQNKINGAYFFAVLGNRSRSSPEP